MAIDLVRPGTLPDEVIESTSASGWATIGRIGSGSVDDLVIKAQQARFRFALRSVETTGDGDKTPVFEVAQLLYCDFSISGYMVASAALGLQAMRLQVLRDNATGNEAQFRMTFNLDGRHAITGNSSNSEIPVMIEALDFQWSANAPVVPVMIVGKVSNDDIANGGVEVRQPS